MLGEETIENKIQNAGVKNADSLPMDTLKLSCCAEDIELAGEIIHNGGLVAFPTETVYGLGANALDAQAVANIYKAKGRPSDNPMIVHIADVSELGALVKGGYDAIPDVGLEIMEAFWPGPLTLILPKADIVPSVTTGGLETVAVRMPANGTAQRMISAAAVPVAAPSANLSGKPSPTTSEDVLEDMDGRIDAIILGEQCNVGIESTVIDLTSEKPTILRPGIITAEWIMQETGVEVAYDKALSERPSYIADPKDGVAEMENAPKSPGMKYKHYSPNAQVRIIEGDDDYFKAKAVELGTAAKREGLKTAVIDYENDARKAAHKLFADLRELDREKYDLILVRALPENGLGFSVMNRLLKSAGYDIVEA